MMKMEIVFSKDKCIKHNIDINECYGKMDRYFERNHVSKTGLGCYEGSDFDPFAHAVMNLPYTDWFLKVVEQWYCWWDFAPKKREDALAGFYEVKAIADRRKQSYCAKL